MKTVTAWAIVDKRTKNPQQYAYKYDIYSSRRAAEKAKTRVVTNSQPYLQVVQVAVTRQYSVRKIVLKVRWDRVARMFHDTYESLAPKYGYRTRDDTRNFDPNSRNGKLMTATVRTVIRKLNILP